ncbi:MBL fold metallo-hydrolase [Lysobacter xanthus]
MTTRIRLGVSGHSHVDPRLAGLPHDAPGREAFPAGWALIEHPRHGRLLFDCGYGRPARDAMRRGLRRVYRHVLGACCPEAGDAATLLEACGIVPGTIDWIVVSHFHPDHVGALREFPNARFVADARAWGTVRRGPLARLHAQVWRELLPDDMPARLRLLGPVDRRLLEGDLASLGHGVDLFGDGEVVTIDLPGHADGQLGLALRHGDERVLLVADAFWKDAQLDAPLPLSWLARRLATHAPIAYEATLDRLRQFRGESPKAWIIPSHCNRTLAAWRSRHPDDVLEARG